MQILKKLWTLYTGNTTIRHFLLGLLSSAVVVGVPALTDWANTNTEGYVQVALIAVLAGVLRKAQKALEETIAELKKPTE